MNESRRYSLSRSALAAVALVGAVSTLFAVLLNFTTAGASGTWNNAIAVPGLAALNTGNYALVDTVSCSSGGNCAVVGSYDNGSGAQGFVVSQTNGVWGTALPVPGLAALNTGNNARAIAVSCPSDGNCAIGGFYRNGSGFQGFVATQSNGTWGTAIPVPGLAALNTGTNAYVKSMSCTSSGNCAISGSYDSGSGYMGFVATQSNGTWGTAIPVPGLAALNVGNNAYAESLSCVSNGNCLVGGYYNNGSGSQGFVASQSNGTWGTAIPVPGLSGLNVGNNAHVTSVSCSSDGSCLVGGYYNNGSGSLGFVASQLNGTWSAAIAVPGLSGLNVGNNAQVTSVSCSSGGNCSIGGFYTDGSGSQVFVATQTNGSWNSATTVPGLSTLNTGNGAIVNSLSCSSDGNCATGGYYTDGSGSHGFVATQSNGSWNSAIAVPGLSALAGGNSATVNSVSCSSDGNCAIGGFYNDGSGFQAFVTGMAAPQPSPSTTATTSANSDPVAPAFTG